MSAAPRRSAQVFRIARLLDVAPDDVHGLDGLPDEELKALHDQISHAMFAEGQAQFARVASLSRTIPGPMAGRLAEKFLPAVLAARVSELLDPARARDLVGRVRVPYLADIAVALDPVRARPVVQELPADRIGEVAREMFARGEYVVMAQFVDTVTLDALFAALAQATPHDLLAVTPLLEWNDNLDHVIAHLPEAQLDRIVAELDAPELAELALVLDPLRFGPIVARLDLDTVARIAAELFAREEHEAMARFAGVVTPETMVAALDAASSRDLLEIAPFLTWNDAVDQVVRDLPDHQVTTLVDDLASGEHWTLGDALLLGLGDEAVETLLSRARSLSAESFARIEQAAADGHLSPQARELLSRAAEVR